MSEFISWLALVMAGISALIALLARRDSQKSADAAEKSARESEKARKLNQSGLLLEDFSWLDKMAAFVSAYNSCPSDEIDTLQAEAKKSFAKLHNLLPDDTELLKALSILFSEFDYSSRQYQVALTCHTPIGKNVLPKEITDAIDVIKAKKYQYLNIG